METPNKKTPKERPFWFCHLFDERYDCEQNNEPCKKCAQSLLLEIKEYLNQDILDDLLDEF